MIINQARFEISNTDVAKCPSGVRHEYAFIGRSNVGKSSLINMLTGRKGLAMTSATPGKTMLINHFLINDSWYIVDLPGYGFASRGKDSRRQLQQIIESYILGREQMTNLFLLIDIRHAPQKIDLEFMEWLGENEVPFSIVFTKADKLDRKRDVRRSLSIVRRSSSSGRLFRRYLSLRRHPPRERRTPQLYRGVEPPSSPDSLTPLQGI